MTTKSKLSLKEKEAELIKKIEKAKNELQRLQEKRKVELGRLACKHGLDAFEDNLLDKHFAKLSKELSHANPS